MSINYHVDIVQGAPGTPLTVNTPLGTLDAGITSVLAQAYAGIADVLAQVDSLVLAGGNVATLANGIAAAGQKVVTVDLSTGFLAGGRAAYLLAGGTIEYNLINTVDSSTQLTLTTNIGTGGIANNALLSMISESEYQAAQAIHHAGALTLPQAMGYVAGGVFNIKAYGAKGNGTTDDTAAIQNTIDAAHAAGGGSVIGDPGTYLVTDTLIFYSGVFFKTNAQAASMLLQAGLQQPAVVNIVFQPTSEKDLFDLTNVEAGQSYLSKVGISGLHLTGDGGTYARYAINNTAADSTFENLGIEGFQVGIRCSSTMGNVYRDIYIGTCSVACVSAVGLSTTDIFNHCFFRESPWGAILEYAYSFQFINCLWETLSVGGVDIYQECAGVQFIGGYSENVPSGAGGTDYGMFYVNKHGTTLAAGLVSIVGGFYGGNNVTPYGSFLDVGKTSYLSQVSVVGTYFARFTRGIRADAANTDYATIFASGIAYAQITTPFTNPTKLGRSVIYGTLPEVGSGTNGPTIASKFISTNYLSLIEAAGAGSVRFGGASADSLADDGYIEIGGWYEGTAGLLLVTMNNGSTIHQAGLFSVANISGGASVVKVSGTANAVGVETDGNLCVFGTSTTVLVKNRLGATVIVKVVRID